jgi:hypothetical protein
VNADEIERGTRSRLRGRDQNAHGLIEVYERELILRNDEMYAEKGTNLTFSLK